MIFRWRDAEQAQHESVGLTRDLSIDGAFVLARTPPPLQAKIKLEGFFPPVVEAHKPLRICGEGRVVRVEAIKHHKATTGFAVMSKRFVLRGGEITR